MRVLNLFAGLGGNRRFWTDCKITAIEYDAKIANIYKDLYPEDTVIVTDAHEYLRKHHKEFDFIWSSPPCQSHSSFRQNIGVRYRGVEPIYADMRLYEEILFLKYNAQAQWVVENVKPYYEPMMNPVKRGRHLFWSNFDIPKFEFKAEKNIRTAQIPQLSEMHGIDLSAYKIPNKRQLLRNCVSSEIGLQIFNKVKK
jgi:DNA (cytosine-5)-methyltransferase 1